MKKSFIFTLIALIIISFYSDVHAQQNRENRLQQIIRRVDYFGNLEYVPGGHARQKLDIYLPKNRAEDDRLPTIVWIHGGAWKGGDKNWCPAFRFVEKGYAVASINYRLSQHAKFPAQIHDCKAAIRWLRANAEKYNIDKRRIGVWGGSAGGHLVALLGVTNNNKKLEGTLGGNLDYSSAVQAVCDYFGPTEFPNYFGDDDERNEVADNAIAELLGGSLKDKHDLAVMASPVTYTGKKTCPFLIMHGTDDKLVPIKQSKMLYEKLKNNGTDVKLHIVEGAGHGFAGVEIDRIVDEFFDKNIKNLKTRMKK